MENSNLKIVLNTVSLYARMVLIMILNFISVRLLLKYLGVEDYGLYNAIGGIVLTLSFVTSVLSSASQRFFAYELGRGRSNELSKVYSSLVLVFVFLSVIILILSETLGEWFVVYKMNYPEIRTSAIQWVFQLSVVSFIISLLSCPFQALVISHEDMNYYALISVFDGVMKLLIVILLQFFFVDKLVLYAILWTFVSSIACLCYYLVCKYKYTQIAFRFNVDKGVIKSIFNYSSWTLFGTVSSTFTTQGLNILLNIFFGAIANAAFAVTRQIYSGVITVASSFFTAVRPQLIKSYSAGDLKRLELLYYAGSKVVYALLLIVILPVFFDIDWFLKLWLGDVPPYVKNFSRLMIVYTFILCLSNPITTIAQANGNVKLYHGLVDGFTLICIPITYCFYKFGYDAQVGYWITIIVFIVAHFVRLYVIKQIFGFNILDYSKKILAPIMIIVAIASIALYFLYSICTAMILSHIICFIVSMVLISLLILAIGLNKYERNILFTQLHKHLKQL